MKTFLYIVGAIALGLVVGYLFGTDRQATLDRAQYQTLKPDTVWIQKPVPADTSKHFTHLKPVKDTSHIEFHQPSATLIGSLDTTEFQDALKIKAFWDLHGYTLHEAVAMQDSLTVMRENSLTVKNVGTVIASYFPLSDFLLTITVIQPAHTDSTAVVTKPPLVIDQGVSFWQNAKFWIAVSIAAFEAIILAVKSL